jgi:RimJ/RimL family protein N-acetyltransferase
MHVVIQISPFGRGTGAGAGEQVAAHIGGYLKSILKKPWWGRGFASETCR